MRLYAVFLQQARIVCLLPRKNLNVWLSLQKGEGEVGFIGVFALIVTCLFGQPQLPKTAGQWEMILMLAVVCSGFGFTLQPVAQRYTTAERTGMFCALSPVTAAILGHLVLKGAVRAEQPAWGDTGAGGHPAVQSYAHEGGGAVRINRGYIKNPSRRVIGRDFLQYLTAWSA